MIAEPNCHKRDCKHFEGVKQPDGTEFTEFVYCAAFPDGIPYEISYGDNKHLSRHELQENDILFEKS